MSLKSCMKILALYTIICTPSGWSVIQLMYITVLIPRTILSTLEEECSDLLVPLSNVREWRDILYKLFTKYVILLNTFAYDVYIHKYLKMTIGYTKMLIYWNIKTPEILIIHDGKKTNWTEIMRQ